MARKKLITRRVAITQGEVMVVNTTTKEVEERDYHIIGSYVNFDKILEIISKSLPSDIKAVQVLNKKVEIKLFGVTEKDFVNYGVELDPNTRKLLKAEDEEAEDEEVQDEETELEDEEAEDEEAEV